MIQEHKIKVDRHRDRCPFCLDEITAGDVWICPPCEAPHHAACRDEHGGCASCGDGTRPRTRPLVDAKAAEDVEDPELASRRTELERQGFEVSSRPNGDLIAIRRPFLGFKLAYTVFVRRVGYLDKDTCLFDEAKLKEEAASAQGSGLGMRLVAHIVMVVYLADSVEPAALKKIGAKPDSHAIFGQKLYLSAVLDRSTGMGHYFRSTPFVGAAIFPRLRRMFERLLDPSAPVPQMPDGTTLMILAMILVPVALAILGGLIVFVLL